MAGTARMSRGRVAPRRGRTARESRVILPQVPRIFQQIRASAGRPPRRLADQFAPAAGSSRAPPCPPRSARGFSRLSHQQHAGSLAS